MEKFRATHGILVDVTIERLGPNDVPRVSADKSDRIPVCIWLIHHARLQFLINPLLKEVTSHFYAVVHQLHPYRACSGYVDVDIRQVFQC